MKLFYTPGSHFARKVRLLAAALQIPLELINIRSTFGINPVVFGNNPLMTVPTLRIEEKLIFDSDVIAAFLVHRYDPDDRFGVLTDDIDILNARSVMNGIMSAEVELVLAARRGVDTLIPERLQKMRLTIAHGLAWLEERSELFSDEPDYPGFHLVALWDHLVFFQHMPAQHFPRLERHVHRLSQLPLVSASHPSMTAVDTGSHHSNTLNTSTTGAQP